MINTYKKRYVVTLLLVGLIATGILVILGQWSQHYIRQVDSRMEEAILYHNQEGVFPSPNGNSMGLDLVLELKIPLDSNRLILYGSSSSLAGIIDDDFNRPVVYGTIGSMSIQSLFIMRSFLESEGLRVSSGDIVKVDISPMLFTRRSLNQEVLVSALKYANRYTVGSDFSVKRNLFSDVVDLYAINSQRLFKAMRYFQASLYGDVEFLYAGASFDVTGYHRFLDFGLANTTLLTTFLNGYDDQNLIVELIFLHPEIQASQTGILFNEWVDTVLMPYLIEKNIPWIDHRSIFDEKDFADKTHLTGEARQTYTSLLEKEIDDFYDSNN